MKTVPLKYLARITLGKMLQASGPREGQEVRPYLKSLSVTETGLDTSNLPEMPFSASEQKNLDLRRGDVVVVEGGSIGRSAYLDQDLRGIHFQNSINRVRPNREVDGRFINYCIIDKRSSGYFEAITNQATIRHLTAEKLARTPIPLCGSNEQRLIADYLDRETAEIDAMAIELNQAMVLIDERFQAEVERCFDYLDAPRMPLRSQIRSMTTGTSVTAAKFAPAAGEPGVLATSAVFGHELDETAVKSVDPHEYARLTCPLRVNTLLVSRMNTMNLVGKAVTVERHLPDVYLPDRLWAVEVEVPRYVYWWTRSQSYREQIRGLAVGASDSMKTLSQQAFRGITLPVPPVAQQHAVAAQLDESAELTGALREELREAKVLLEERRSALISAAVRGQIDVAAQGVSVAEQLRDELEVHV